MTTLRQKEFIDRQEEQLKNLAYKIYKKRKAGEDFTKEKEAFDKVKRNVASYAQKQIDTTEAGKRLKKLYKDAVESLEKTPPQIDRWRNEDSVVKKITKGKAKTFESYQKNTLSSKYDDLSDYVKNRAKQSENATNREKWMKLADKLNNNRDYYHNWHYKKSKIVHSLAEERQMTLNNYLAERFNRYNPKRIAEKAAEDYLNSHKELQLARTHADKAAENLGRINRFYTTIHNILQNNKKAWRNLEKESREKAMKNGVTYTKNPKESAHFSLWFNTVNNPDSSNLLTSMHETEHANEVMKYWFAYISLLIGKTNSNYYIDNDLSLTRQGFPVEELRADNGIIRNIKNSNLSNSQKKQMIRDAKVFRRSQIEDGYMYQFK